MNIPPVLAAVTLAAILGQGLKMLLVALRNQRLVWHDLITTGGMPSAHSAVTTALATSVLLTEGVSNLFIACLVLAVLVIRDAMGVRRVAGEEGVILTKVIRKLRMKAAPMHYSLGHTPAQVAVGILLGLACGLVVLIL
jgi:acid phosphatase family membrane protein YuiD